MMNSNFNNKIIAIVGMCGAGKSQVADYLVDKSFNFIRFGQITLDILKERGVSGEAEEKKIREELRKKHGMAAFAILNIPKIDNFLSSGKSVVVDGLYSWSEYKVLSEKYGSDFKVLAVYASPKLRYERLSRRADKHGEDKDLRHRSFTPEEAKNRDYAEIENIEKGGPIVMADYTIINDANFDKIYQQVDEFLNLLD